MKSHPYIGEGRRGSIVLFSADSSGFAISHENKTVKGKYTNHWDECAFTDITHDYLQNTYGEVVSPEHAEFIIELAENAKCAGVDICKTKANSYNVSGMYFNFYIDSGVLWFSFSALEMASCRGEKQITIPLPPKEPLKNAGDNLILGCEDSKCDEWPQVGDEVALRYKFDSKQIMHIGKLLYLSGNHIIIATDKNSDYHCHRCDWRIEKPKTPEEELRDDLINSISSCLTFIPGMLDKSDEVMRASHQAACNLMAKYNITKKPQ